MNLERWGRERKLPPGKTRVLTHSCEFVGDLKAFLTSSDE